MSQGESARRPGTAARRRAPLMAVHGVAFFSSLGTGVITNGVFFVAVSACGFSAARNFALGLLLGLMYVVGAFGVGPALRRMARTSRRVTTRGVLTVLSLTMGIVALVPHAVALAGVGAEGLEWTLWLVVAVYAPTSGAFWPIVQSFVSGGRAGEDLRRAVGQFNTVWSSAVVLAFWLMGPLLAHHPLATLSGFGVLQMGCTLFVRSLGAEPGAALPDRAEPHPAVYVPLLTTFRLLLPTSYYVAAVWSPYAPTVLGKLEIAQGWQAPIAATWLLTRCATFALLERWHGWHGRWAAVGVGVGCMVSGVVMALASPILGSEAGLAALIAGLSLLGLGNGVIYTGALYYAMEVGAGRVDAGGKHEGLIGVGFTAGPATGLAATGLVASGVIGAEHLDLAMIALLGLALLGIGVPLARRVARERAAV